MASSSFHARRIATTGPLVPPVRGASQRRCDPGKGSRARSPAGLLIASEVSRPRGFPLRLTIRDFKARIPKPPQENESRAERRRATNATTCPSGRPPRSQNPPATDVRDSEVRRGRLRALFRREEPRELVPDLKARRHGTVAEAYDVMRRLLERGPAGPGDSLHRPRGSRHPRGRAQIVLRDGPLRRGRRHADRSSSLQRRSRRRTARVPCPVARPSVAFARPAPSAGRPRMTS